MIKIVRGDLLQATEDIICHSVNCQGKMNSGVAKSIRAMHPIVFTEYEKLVNDTLAEGALTSSLLGNVQGISVGGGRHVANMFGQNQYGYDGSLYTNTNALFECFKTVRSVAEKAGLSVAMPYMVGCYRGGADWKIVEDHLITAFDGYEVTLYKLHMG
ncbi:Appr-1-p processing protein [Priestia aryabhattai]|uniref:Appr-1-p processing protein n=1 Tax=Priestia aryabhattai TaxID=412384 RepID=UPI0039A3D342